MVTLTDLAAIVSAVAVLLGVGVASFQLRNFVQLRQIDLVIRLYSKFGEAEYQRAYSRALSWQFKDFEDWDHHASAEDQAVLYTVCLFFEDMGLLLKRKLAKIDLLDDLLSTAILETWEKLEFIIQGERKKRSRPQFWEWFEYLYKAMKERDAQV